ncbi:DUF3010 family protein [Catenovulum sediminis]|uniref:DUF3010 family protein n=1 Tax=Catenovulum sediminis TaxID=1740262 RepID=A0ABV1RF48_9ALTE|nr:DUF3010 family protein [Catenovulum sediminis]
MRACGVEIKSNEAIICLLSMENGLFDIPDCRSQKFLLKNAASGEELQEFQFAFKKLMEDYQIQNVVIKERPMKGKFAGSCAGFKIEAAIQLIDGLSVELQNNTLEKALLKKNPLAVDFKSTGLKVFQQTAFTTAYCYLLKEHYGVPQAD